MNKVLVTGGGHLLDCHVIKRLNERGIRPRSLVLPHSRREAEQLALSRSRPGFEVVVVAPALTIGPEDFGPAPGGSLIKPVVAGRFVPTVDMGVGSSTCAISPTASCSRRSAAVPANVTSYVPTTPP